MAASRGSRRVVDDAFASDQTKRHAGAVLAPLDADESTAAIESAMRAVTEDGSVSRERLTVFPPRLRIEKSVTRNGTPQRLVWVRLRDRDRMVVHEVFVSAGSVVEHVVNEFAAPGISESERNDVTGILRGEPDIAEVLDREDLAIEWFCPGHGPERRVGVRVMTLAGERVVEQMIVVVDLDAGAIVNGGDRGGELG